MIVLGLSFGYHDSSAALVIDGCIKSVVSEERLTRIKHDSRFPLKSIEFCLKQNSLGIDDIDAVVYYENHALKQERIVSTALLSDDKSILEKALKKHFFDIDAYPLVTISKMLNISIEKVHFCAHHEAHVAAAFYPSIYKEAAILTIDGVGEYETMSISLGNQIEIKQLKSQNLPHSLGLLYSAFTAYLGFEVNEGEYKVMGMSSFGKPRYVNEIMKTISIQENGELWIDEEYYDMTGISDSHIKQPFYEIFEKPRSPEMSFDPNGDDMSRYYADVAASIQAVAEDVIIKNAKEALRLCNSKNLCYGGGVALNATANGKIKRELDLDGFFVQPAAGDAGSAIGAALYFTHKMCKIPRQFKAFNPYLGPKELNQSILCGIQEYMCNFEVIKEEESYVNKISVLLSKGNVVGWFYDRSEMGPRALGHRSIVADPRGEHTKDRVNQSIKFREVFRPFAPSVLKEFASEWFEMNSPIDSNTPDNYMIGIVDVKAEKKKFIPAVTHIDGTARIQLVSNGDDLYTKLIKAFRKKTGVPILLNTSFNLRGEPIVQNILDALKTFEISHMDVLAAYPYIIYKEGVQ